MKHDVPDAVRCSPCKEPPPALPAQLLPRIDSDGTQRWRGGPVDGGSETSVHPVDSTPLCVPHPLVRLGSDRGGVCKRRGT